MTKRNLQLMIRAFNGECDAAIASARWNNVVRLQERIRKSFEAINKAGLPISCSISWEYLKLKNDELHLAFEYQEKLHEEREEQRRIREQMREEEKVRKDIDRALQEAAKKEALLKNAMKKIKAQMKNASVAQREKYEAKIRALEERLREAEVRRERAMSMAEQTRRGHVYVISNVGSFGDNVYKIGLTRRLEPLDRVRELGDSSVPFPFDVHAMIFSEDAPGLEARPHRHFALSQVNKANHRREFFRDTISHIREEVAALGIKDVQWTMAAEAREYHETLAIERAIAGDPAKRDGWLQRQLLLEPKDFEIIEEAEEVSA